MKTKFKHFLMALVIGAAALGTATIFSSCGKDDPADSDLCFGLTQEECDRLY